MSRVTPAEIEAFVAGELAAEDAERVREALLVDEAVAAELEACLQARALGAALGAQPAVLPLVRRSRARWIAGAIAIAAAAAVLLLWLRRDDGAGQVMQSPVDSEVRLALAARRGIEPRLAWSGADLYRGYDTERGHAATSERLSFELLAKIEKTQESAALVAAHVLIGNLERAGQLLEQPHTADGWSDRAALALLARDSDSAYLYAGRALALSPEHPQATWNRALAAVGLGLDRLASSLFDRIASFGERGWADEAKLRAAALRAQRMRRDQAYQTAQAAGDALVGGGPVEPALAIAPSFPGLMRLAFYDAVRTATSAQRMRELAPLAHALDARFGGDVLARHLERAGRGSMSRRAALAPRYLALRRGQLSLDDARAVVDAARGEDDVRLGAMVLAAPVQSIEPRYLQEFLQLAGATNDPWFALLAIEHRAQAAFAAGDIAGAELALRGAGCDAPAAMPYRCQRITRLLAHVDNTMDRMRAAEQAWRRSRELAIADGFVPFETELLAIGSSIIVTRDSVSGSLHDLALAYFHELELAGAPCELTRPTREGLAQSLINRSLVDEARALMANEPPCKMAFTADRAFVLGQLATTPAAMAELRREMEALRKSPDISTNELAVLEHTEGRLRVAAGDASGRDLLAARTRRPAADVLARRIRSFDYAVLVDDAGRRGAFDEALRWLADERGARVPDRCVVGASKDTDAVFAVRGADGVIAGLHRKVAPGDPLTLPADLAARLATCSVIDIFARAPFYGRPELLGPTVAARFRATTTLVDHPGNGTVVVVTGVVAPRELGLSPLQPVVGPATATVLDGQRATPAAVLASITHASYVEIHAHSLVEGDGDGSIVVLSPDGSGRYALGARDLAAIRLATHPVIVLAACEASSTGSALDSTWGLADAFLAAGASAVIASPSAVGDADAPAVFTAIRTKITAGTPPTIALQEVRRGWAVRSHWLDHLVVFQ